MWQVVTIPCPTLPEKGGAIIITALCALYEQTESDFSGAKKKFFDSSGAAKSEKNALNLGRVNRGGVGGLLPSFGLTGLLVGKKSLRRRRMVKDKKV